MMERMLEEGWKKFRSQQLFMWLYRKRVVSFDEMSDLSTEMRDKLKEMMVIDPLSLVKRMVSKDGTVKYLFRLQDGSLAETVLMHYDYGKSVCVSSQIGCNMGCAFCASGLLKKTRDLTSGEMVAQVMYVQRELDLEHERVSHVVVMGTGEPFDNYENVIDFMHTINHDKGLAIGARHLTVSTCGIVEKIRRFAHENVQYNLAISLHAPNDELRNRLMPINRANPLKELMDAIHEYADLNNRRITFEYILLKDVNDQDEHVHQLAALIRGLNAYVNLIPYNEVDEHGFKGVSFPNAMQFYDRLVKAGVKCTLRKEHGADIDAACGQLRAKVQRGDYDDLLG
ncbi:MAG: 23S rRNA (adenine(2503)-C(2))-methyltransferase RlmN [Erysipelotrichales bacterium]|nr:MAG: 23S rRNA (adenine(2503)-C(2))-methyltransferase RlmN [Erysipelotrichales bacterium]